MLRARDLSDGREPVSYEELDVLADLARSLPPQPLIVNIGAAAGLSTLAFLEARPDCTIYSVDVEPCPQEMEHVAQGGHDRERVIRLLGRSQDIGPDFPERCDLLFVDGDHWDAGGDIEAWVKTGKVKPGGIVAFHDYMEVCPPNNPGDVYAQVNEGMAGYEPLLQADRLIAFRMRDDDGDL